MAAPDSTLSAAKKAPRPPLPKGQRMFLWVSAIAGMALFLMPTFYVVKYNVVDKPREDGLVRRYWNAPAKSLDPQAVRLLYIPAVGNVALQTRVALESSDVPQRSLAVTGMARLMQHRSVSFQYPMEAINVKTTLAHVATHDPEAGIRKAAGDALQAIASQGAVISR